MSAKFFLDTNIFVYSFDKNDQRKQQVALALITNALKKDKGIISYQVIQEFTNVALQKFSRPLTFDDCKTYIENFLYPLCEVHFSLELLREAIDIKKETGIGFYDSLIVAGAVQGNAEILYTEDLNDGQKIRGVEIRNPFKE